MRGRWSVSWLTRVLVAVAILAGGCSQERNQSIEHANRGVDLFRQQLYPQAVREFKLATDLDPRNEKAFYSLAMAYVEMKNWDLCADSLNKAIQIAPKNALYQYQLGHAYIEQKRLDLAQAALEKAISIDEKLYKAHYRLGWVYDVQDKPQEADKHYRLAIAGNPRFALSFDSMAKLYLSNGFVDPAVQVLKEGVKVSPQEAGLWNTLGVALQEQKQFDQAVKSFDKALELDQKMTDAIFNIAMTHLVQGNKPEAKKFFEKFKSQGGNPGRPEYTRFAEEKIYEIEAATLTPEQADEKRTELDVKRRQAAGEKTGKIPPRKLR
jgi:tetratricopeptide (TPR) repeat protein